MKILITGGSGFIGKCFIEKFSKNHEIFVITHKKDDQVSDNYKNIICAVEDEKIIEKISEISPDIILHLAAITGIKKCEEYRKKSFLVNVYGTLNILESCKKINAKIIFASSREVYGETIEKNTKEDAEKIPNNIYGITKKLAEELILDYNRKFNIPYTIFRITNVYGPRGDQYGAQVIIKNALDKQVIDILGGEQIINYIYIDDVIEILEKAIMQKEFENEIFNLGGESVTLNQFIDTVINLIKMKIQKKYYPIRNAETKYFKPNIEKIELILDHKLTTLVTGLEKTIAWYKLNN